MDLDVMFRIKKRILRRINKAVISDQRRAVGEGQR